MALAFLLEIDELGELVHAAGLAVADVQNGHWAVVAGESPCAVCSSAG